MLGLVAAQLKHRCEASLISQRPVWVDVRFFGVKFWCFEANQCSLVAEQATSTTDSRSSNPACKY